MASSKDITVDPTDCSAESEEQLFNAIESNNISVVQNFTQGELQQLCKIRRLFESEWSSPEKEQQTAYQRACLLGRTDIVQWILNTGIEPNQIFSDGDSQSTIRGAFLFACQSHSMSTIIALLTAGAPVDQLGSCSLDYANSFAPGIRIFNSFSDEWASRENLYPIHFAIVDNNLELLQKLITPTTNKLLTIYWFTPLHIACLFNRSRAMIDVLLSYEDANLAIIAKTRNGKFPDELATDPTIIEYLRPRRLLAYAEVEKNHEHDSKLFEEDTEFQIFAKTHSGRTITFMVTRKTTVDDLKARIHDKEGTSPFAQRITFGGKQLQEGYTLNHYAITKGATLHLVLGLPGGYYY